jgi:hypothetical protein
MSSATTSAPVSLRFLARDMEKEYGLGGDHLGNGRLHGLVAIPGRVYPELVEGNPGLELETVDCTVW